MANFEIIKCHGSGNDFILVDTTLIDPKADISWSDFARIACNRNTGIGSDGVLLLVRNAEGLYGMDMLNPDGTHAEMCGNGIRCVARLAHERGYLDAKILTSGGRLYPVERATEIAPGIETFSVDIPISLQSSSFGFTQNGEEFIGKTIENLNRELQFTALNLGNPHIVARTEEIDLSLLKELGERVLTLKEEFPDGINLSLYKVLSESSIFVATYERGAGITLSCGTAMTASATAATLLKDICPNRLIEVRNRGGKVNCATTINDGTITTRLEGNATFEWWGEANFDNSGVLSYNVTNSTEEGELWQRFVATLNK